MTTEVSSVSAASAAATKISAVHASPTSLSSGPVIVQLSVGPDPTCGSSHLEAQSEEDEREGGGGGGREQVSWKRGRRGKFLRSLVGRCYAPPYGSGWSQSPHLEGRYLESPSRLPPWRSQVCVYMYTHMHMYTHTCMHIHSHTHNIYVHICT